MSDIPEKNPNRIEILELPSGKFTWIVHHAGVLMFASPAEHDDVLDAELDAKLYARHKHPGVVFDVDHHKQVYPT